MRIDAMLTDSSVNYDYYLQHGPYKTDRLNVSSFKLYADGALGSRGACLINEYADKPGWHGFLLKDTIYYRQVIEKLYNTKFQVCTHAIGDSGNREILKIYAAVLKEKNDRRWRIEHAQVVNENDFHFFGDYNIIPSVQPTHATSDMYWAEQRLGPVAIKGAYAYQQLLKQNNWIPLGTDFPIEDISPLKTFYAAVMRQDSKGFPAGGFQMENALTREEALRGISIWAARSGFEEKEKGSLEAGKFADFIILDKDLMQCSPAEMLGAQVTTTFIFGERVYKKR
jgi:predicted amidohydrolase YtcJ